MSVDPYDSWAATYVVSSDCAGGVSGDELELHVDLSEQILVLGLEPRPRCLVQGESQQLSVVEYLSPAISPGNVEILVQVPGADGYKEAHK